MLVALAGAAEAGLSGFVTPYFTGAGLAIFGWVLGKPELRLLREGAGPQGIAVE